jgi:hypothetical protein
LGFGRGALSALDSAKPDRVVDVSLQLVDRHGEEHFRVLTVEVRQPIRV